MRIAITARKRVIDDIEQLGKALGLSIGYVPLCGPKTGSIAKCPVCGSNMLKGTFYFCPECG